MHEKIIVFLKNVAGFYTFELFPRQWTYAQPFYTCVATKISASMQTNCKAIWPAFIAHNKFKNCLDSVICFSSTNFGQKFFLSIADSLSCINVQCFCMACYLIVKPITYFFSGSTNPVIIALNKFPLFSVFQSFPLNTYFYLKNLSVLNKGDNSPESGTSSVYPQSPFTTFQKPSLYFLTRY